MVERGKIRVLEAEICGEARILGIMGELGVPEPTGASKVWLMEVMGTQGDAGDGTPGKLDREGREGRQKQTNLQK